VLVFSQEREKNTQVEAQVRRVLGLEGGAPLRIGFDQDAPSC